MIKIKLNKNTTIEIIPQYRETILSIDGLDNSKNIIEAVVEAEGLTAIVDAIDVKEREPLIREIQKRIQDER